MKRERLLHLHYALADQWHVMAKLLRLDPELERIYELSPHELEHLLALSSQKSLRLFQHLHSTPASALVNGLETNHIDYLTIWDDLYPKLLREIPDPPFILYCKGKIELLRHPRKIAVVGARKPSSYGITSIQSILANLLRDNWLVVSGLAYGIDTIAHIEALERGRGTIAVLGGGFFHLYPKENYRKLQKWHNSVLLVSEYPPSYKVQKWYFPKRNRIISGLSLGVIVAEARIRSGSLITADCALEQNREVFAIPGPIHLETAVGTNRLIQQGAKLTMHAEDIKGELRIN
ncbi:MAG: DNA-processing protein DprA [Ectobacillus sp.]